LQNILPGIFQVLRGREKVRRLLLALLLKLNPGSAENSAKLLSADSPARGSAGHHAARFETSLNHLRLYVRRQSCASLQLRQGFVNEFVFRVLHPWGACKSFFSRLVRDLTRLHANLRALVQELSFRLVSSGEESGVCGPLKLQPRHRVLNVGKSCLRLDGVRVQIFKNEITLALKSVNLHLRRLLNGVRLNGCTGYCPGCRK
jgi:hypothetical protein